MQPAGDAVRIRVQPGVRGIAVRTLPGELLQRYTDIMSGASALFNVARRVQIRDGVVSNWVGNLGLSMQTRQPRSYIAHEDGHIRSVPRDQQQAAQLRPSRRREGDFLKSAENVDIDNAGRLRSVLG